ncbi:hypothetical protein AAC387_Pa02g0665 [Persea americana]
MTTLLRHIFSLTQLPTPPPPKSSQQHQQQQQQQQQHQQEQQQQSPHSKTSRRNAIFFFSFLSLTQTPKASSAFSFGIPGPKEWLKDQKKKTSKFLLAPIDASRESLRNASVLLKTTTPDSSTKDLGEEVQKLLKSAARDCVSEDRNSFVSFQAQTGVEVCTFSLILKNASSLLDDRNPIKLETEAILGDLVRSFTFLNGELSTSDLQLPSDRQKVEDMLTDTISSLEKFEEGVKNCLDA